MSLRVASIGYVPPPRFPNAEVFLENLNKFKPTHELFLYSDHKDYNVHPLNCPPEEIVRGGILEKNPRWAINNVVFGAGIRLAAKCGFTHIIYLEIDCRVGCAGWDSIIFEEYFNLPFPAVAAGSLNAQAMVNGGGRYFEAFRRFYAEQVRTKRHAIPIYGVPVPPEKAEEYVAPGDSDNRFKPTIYANGALGVYDVAWMCELFKLQGDGSFQDGHNIVNDFALMPAWDYRMGHLMYDRFGADIFDGPIAHLDSVYSGYANRLNTESERMRMLLDRKAVAVHQVKSNATL